MEEVVHCDDCGEASTASLAGRDAFVTMAVSGLRCATVCPDCAPRLRREMATRRFRYRRGGAVRSLR